MKASRCRVAAASGGAYRAGLTIAELEFRFELFDRFSSGRLASVDVTTLAWKATRAGAGGVKDLAVDPALKGDNHARIVRSALGLGSVEDDVLYECDVPLWDVYKGDRSERKMLVKLPHEAIARDFMHHRDAYLQSRQDPANINVPAFLEHPVTQEVGPENCWPIGYYTDKVKLGNESFYRGSAKVTLMRSSITCWLLKTSELCRCGCNGLCTLDCLQLIMNASLNALTEKMFMSARFDRRPWRVSDKRRAARAGFPMDIQGAVTEYRADLPERCLAARVKSHGGYYGCLGCLLKSSELHSRVAEVSLLSQPWVARTHERYLEEVSSHLVSVSVTSDAERDGLGACLVWTQKYPWGRRVEGRKGSPWGLAANDQLVLSDDCHNPHDLESLKHPFKVFFFRPRKDSGIIGVSTLISIPGVHSLGINGFTVLGFAECTLHTLDLGVAQRYNATAMVRALKANVYKLPYKTQTALVQRGSLAMGKDIKTYYTAEHKLNPWKKLSVLPKTFSYRQLGKVAQPCLKAKGGQTRGLVKFATQLMQKHDTTEKGKLLAMAGNALLELYETMESEPRVVSFSARKQMVSAMVNHDVFYRAAGGHMVYKHHGALHMVLSAGWHGNPKFVSTYEDEHENGVIARVGLHVHGLTFAKSIFERLELHNPERLVLQIL
jgi:hypothetical protein